MAENKALTQGLGILGPTDEARQRAQRISQSTAPLRRGIGSQVEGIQRSMSMGPVLGIMDQLSRIGAPLAGLAFEGASPVASGLGLERSGAGYDIMGDKMRGMLFEPNPVGSRIEEISKVLASGGTLDPVNVSTMPEEIGNSGSGMTNIFGVKGGRGNVIEKPGERPIGGRGRIIEQPGERAAAMEKDEPKTEVAADPAQQGFLEGMQEYINAVRGETGVADPRSLDEYKKEFAEATGIDISGKPDKSAALMAFGLALMQNRAGKGFNVGRILRSVGEAGEAALPALEKAKQEARNNAIAAGKYALEMRSADRTKAEAAKEKAMSRQNYYVVPKGEGVSGFLANMDKGSLEPLNVYELNKLQSNPDFTSKYDIVPGSMWGTIVEEAMQAPEAQELYLTKNPVEIPLFTGVDDDLFKIRVYDPDPNKNPKGRPLMVGDGQEQYEALARMARDNEKAKQTFVELGALNEGTNIFRYSLDAVNRLASAFNITFSDDVPETERMRMILEKMQAKNAPAILGEAGKTISDGDRERVRLIVGDITATSDPRVLAAKFEGLFNDIILGAESDIRQALSTLNRYTGRNIGAAIGQGDLNEDERKELETGLKALGMM